MTSPFRLYSFVNQITKTKSHQLINFHKVSKIELKSKVIKITLSNNHELYGNFIMLSGSPITENIYYDTNEEAQKEFEEIKNYLDKLYK